MRENRAVKKEDIKKILSEVEKKLQINSKTFGDNKPSVIWDEKYTHSYILIKFFEEILGQTFSKSVWETLSIFHILTVDFVDSIAEEEGLRTYSKQIKLFEGIKEIVLYGNEKSLFHFNEGNEIVILESWQNYFVNLSIYLHKIIKKNKSVQQLLSLLDLQISNYYKFISFVHTHQENTSSEALQWFKDNDFNDDNPINVRSRPKWVESDKLWAMFFGDSVSFASTFFLGLIDIRISKEQIKNLLMAWRTIGVLNVFLDDINDFDQDQSQNVPNILSEVKKELFDSQLTSCKKFLENYKITYNEWSSEFIEMEIVFKSVLYQIKLDQSEIDLTVDNYPMLSSSTEILVTMMFNFYLDQGGYLQTDEELLQLMSSALSFYKKQI